MDVLVVTPWFPNERDGWPAPFIADSVIALAQAGAEIRVLATRAWHPPIAERMVGPIHRGTIRKSAFPELNDIRVLRHLALPGETWRQVSNLALDAALRRAIRKSIRNNRPDIIHVHTEGLAPAVVRAARDAGIPSVVTIHGKTTNRKFLYSYQQLRRFKNALSSANEILIVGNTLRAFAEALAGRTDHIDFLPNGVNAPDQVRRAPDPDDGPVEIISVGNLERDKGIHLSLIALSELSKKGITNWRFTIIGEGKLRGELEQLARQIGISGQTSFLGILRNDDVRRLLANADIFVLPSYREAFGVAYLEAMAAGLATVGVEGQGPSQFIRHGESGYLVPPNDVHSLKTLLESFLLGDRVDWRAVAAAGQLEVLNEYSWEEHARKLIEIYHSLAST